MAHGKQYYVYLLSNRSSIPYVGVTFPHKQKLAGHFSAKYNITQLVYFETTEDIRDAIAREKQTKGWRRSKKLDLIPSMKIGTTSAPNGPAKPSCETRRDEDRFLDKLGMTNESLWMMNDKWRFL